MLKKLFTIGCASILIGVGINGFVLPSHLINGGIWGISLLMNYLWGFKLAVIFTCLNLPIYFLAMKYNLSLFFNGLIGTLISAIGINLLYPISGLFQLPILLNVILGGMFIGTGVGMMLRIHASPGGVDLLALIISKWLSVNVGIVILIIDILIILTGVVILKDERMLYSLVIVTIVGLIASVMTSIKSIRMYV
ncbi:MAG TPA: YitT family protein [Pseudoneobacillus sp.]|nr:YitT family protein [Pseudoneobacillus sp.]